MVSLESISAGRLVLMLFGFAFLFFIPGIVIIETWYHKLASALKPALVIVLSILVSSFVIYGASLLVGFGSRTIIISALPFFVWLCLLIIFKRDQIKNSVVEIFKDHWLGITLSICLAVLFFVALFPAIFTHQESGYVLAFPNWQDTAMHLGIISSIAEGNFPPEAPYYAGVPLNYYYFSDFHSSILVALSGGFFPRVLVYTNPMFALAFALSLYALGYLMTQRRLTGIFSSIIGLMYGNFMFVRFIKDYRNFSGEDVDTLSYILSSKTYTIDYLKLLTVSPMSDYFLQNRPAMVGLSVFTLVLILLYAGIVHQEKKILLLAGLVTGAVLKFHYFAFISSGLACGLIALWHIKHIGFKKIVILGLWFLVPVISFLALIFTTFSVGGHSAFDLLKNNLQWQAWTDEPSVMWHLKFFFANFGLQVGLVVIAVILIVFRKLERKYIFFLALILLLALPAYTYRFTINQYDMLKFLYFAVIPASFLSAVVVTKSWNIRYLGIPLAILILLTSSFTSLLVLGNSYYNKWHGYSNAEYEVGMWLRENSERRSVFITAPTVHSPVTQIAGRLRVLSYTTWPYSHGYNSTDDNIFSRLDDIRAMYSHDTSKERRLALLDKYQVDYIYVGRTEQNDFSDSIWIFDQLPTFRKIYGIDGIAIYKVLR